MSNKPRPSATVCVLHQGEAGFDVLMVRRSSTARFMAGAWVFPGGVVDADDHAEGALATISGEFDPDLGPWLAAAFREVAEETGVWLSTPTVVESLADRDVFAVAATTERSFDANRIAYFANWITPTMIPVRFDARFFIVEIEDPVRAIPDEREVDAAEFVGPTEALRRAEAGEWLVPFPTQRTLQQLEGFESVAAAFDEWRNRNVISIQPRMRVAGDGSLEVLMPGDAGFEDLDDEVADPELLTRAAQAAAQRGQPIAEAGVVQD